MTDKNAETLSPVRPAIRASHRGRLIAGLVFGVVLGAPGLASAQLDDPGLAPAAPTTTTTTPAQPAATTPTVTPAAEQNTQRAEAYVAPKAEPKLVSTDTKEETKTEKGSPSELEPGEWELRLVAPSLSGAVGLFHMLTAEVGKPLNFRVGSHLQFFTAKSFLISGAGTMGQPGFVPGDENSRFLGDLTISFTGPDITFLRNLEAFLTIYNASNQNIRTDPGRTDPTVILALADVGWGLKGAWHVAKGFSLGGTLGVRFFNSVSGVSANFDATAVNVDLLAMYDVRHVAPKVPIRIHLNLGYQYDNSLALLPKDAMGRSQCFASTGNDACIRSRVVQTFAYGINNSRVRFALGLELPFRPKVKWGYFGIAPLVEYHVESATGDGDKTVGNALGLQADSDLRACQTAECRQRVADFRGRITNPTSQMITIGLRFRPVARLVIDTGVDLALQSPGFQFGPPLATWNYMIGAAYTYGPEATTVKTTTRTITNTYEVGAPRAPEGKLSGVVRDAKTKAVIAGAVVKYGIKGYTAQATGDDGVFTSYALPPGPVKVFVSHPDYESVEQPGSIQQDSTTKLDITLKAKPPKEGRARVRVVDNREAPVMNATIRFQNAAVTREANVEGEQYIAALPAGEYSMSIDSPQFLAKEKQITITANQDTNIDVSLVKRPTKSHVELTATEIVIKGTINFETAQAKILPEGQKILDEVADVLAKNPQVRRISVEGHTDNSGDAEKNLQLSKDRAAACVEYLVKGGIGRDRLVSSGYGSEKPLVPNTSGANKAKNRRVEFKITDQSGGGTGGVIMPQ